MKINILTIFPEMFDGWMNCGMVGIAKRNDIIEFNIIDFREYAENKHNKVDDYPFGGGEGMLLMAQPIDSAIMTNNLDKTNIIFPSPLGKVFNQEKADQLSKCSEITLIAGRYEGIDQRVLDMHVDEMISLGDFIITGGELAIQTILDAVIRLIPGVLNNGESFVKESFSDNLLEHPQYTRPREFKGMEVPEVLTNGNHKLIDEWKYQQSLSNTKKYRPDLLEKSKEKDE